MNYRNLRHTPSRTWTLSADDGADGGGAGGGGETSSGGGAATVEGGAGGDQVAFYETFADADLKTHPSVHKFKSAEELARGYVHMEKRFGVPAERLLTLPEKLDDPAAMAEIFKKLGAPDTPEGYQINWEGATDADKATVTEFAKFMHEKGPFPPQALAAAAEFWRGQVTAGEEAETAAIKAAREAGEAELRTAWGAAYDQTGKAIGKLIDDLGGAELRKELDETGLGDSPKLAKLLAKVVEMRAEPGPSGDGQRADMPAKIPNPSQAMARARELETHPGLMDKDHPQHKEVVAERTKMLVYAQGGTPA